jgi:hypothetical protein
MSRAYPMRQTVEILSIALLQTKISILGLSDAKQESQVLHQNIW